MSDIHPVEISLGEEGVSLFANSRCVLTYDADLVQLRFYASDNRTLLAHIGLTPKQARTIGGRAIAGANRIDPQGAVALVSPSPEVSK